MSIFSFLALFTLLAIASGVYFISQRLRFPYTIGLAATGVFLVPFAQTSFFGFIDNFTLTPEVLFYLFLPLLIFESAFQMNIRRIMENIWSISAFSVISLLISTFTIAAGLYFILPLVGLAIPFSLALLFGSLISATDPVAVLALFKEYGAPKRLALIFEGESLFNDATAVALFFVILEIATKGFAGLSSIGSGIIIFLEMIIGGIIFGLALGGIFSKLLGKAKLSESVSISLMLVSAHLTFILAEIISQNLSIAGHHIHLSAIITTTVASMVIGNYGRSKLTVSTEHFVEKFFGQGAFIVNSIIFILIGLLFSQLPGSTRSLVLPIAITIATVMAARAISIYPVAGLLNILKREANIPAAWQHLLAWGSLRGALAIILVFLVPADWSPAHWNYPFTPQELLLTLTIACIFTTLFVKGLSIGPFMKFLGLKHYTKSEGIMAAQTEVMMHKKGLEKMAEYKEKGYIEDDVFKRVHAEYQAKLESAQTKLSGIIDTKAGEKLLRLYAIGIERLYLKNLYANDEMPESVFRRVKTKLAIQEDAIEYNQGKINESQDIDAKDIFEYLARRVRSIMRPPSESEIIWRSFMYYRTQTIIARKVLKEIGASVDFEEIFSKEALDNVRALYEHFRDGSHKKMRAVAEAHQTTITPLLLALAKKSVAKIENQALIDFYDREMVAQKVFVRLKDSLNSNI